MPVRFYNRSLMPEPDAILRLLLDKRKESREARAQFFDLVVADLKAVVKVEKAALPNAKNDADTTAVVKAIAEPLMDNTAVLSKGLPYFIRRATLEVRSYLRDEVKRGPAARTDGGQTLDRIESKASGPSEEAEQKELVELYRNMMPRFRKAIRRLDPDALRVFNLKIELGLTDEKIDKLLGIQNGKAAKKFRLVKAKLRQLVVEDENE